ncbi:MAG: hypothetical protein ACD_79C00053G0006 [uncultured bacterium]|nr:MAG: hypothetical protein ACD_79C00053G0006 [uncultured bacterium]
MVDIQKKVSVEFYNIQIIVNELKKIKDIHKLSFLEIGGVANLIHNFYNGIENILKQILKDKNISVPEGSSWHRDLIYLSSSEFCLSENTKENLTKYLSFRHFFVHNYSIDLDPHEIEPLVKLTEITFTIFKNEIESFLKN